MAHRESTVTIEPSWNLVDQIPLEAMAAERTVVPQITDVYVMVVVIFMFSFTAGWTCNYDKSYDRVSFKLQKNVEAKKENDVMFYRVPCTTDPYMQQLAKVFNYLYILISRIMPNSANVRTHPTAHVVWYSALTLCSHC